MTERTASAIHRPSRRGSAVGTTMLPLLERHEIQVLLGAGHTHAEIAKLSGGRRADRRPDRCRNAAEICNRIDHDCAGRIDEGLRNSCGECAAEPVETCEGVD